MSNESSVSGTPLATDSSAASSATALPDTSTAAAAAAAAAVEEEASESVTVESSDVIRLMLQFMKEHSLVHSMEALQKESGVTLNSVANLTHFATDIETGRWDAVIREVSTLSLPERKSMDLYEHICHEMVEHRDFDAARAILQHAGPLRVMKRQQPDRYLKLATLLRNDRTGLYAHGSKEKVRGRLAEELLDEVIVVPAGRLQVLLNSALKFEQLQGRLKPGTKYDLFRGATARRKKEPEMYPRRLAGEIPFPPKSHPEACAFSPDGLYIVTGSADGFIEVWDFETCKFPKALTYQLEDKLMLHNDAILSLCFSRDSAMLASASAAGQIKVWRVATGKCLRRFNRAHSKGIVGLCFNRDGSQIASCSFDETARIHGLRSGKTLREFKGHTAFVNSVVYASNDAYLLTASTDGSVKVWNSKTSECVSSFRPPQREAMVEVPLIRVVPLPRASNLALVCAKSSIAYLINLQGQVVKTFDATSVPAGTSAGGESATQAPSNIAIGDFVDCAVSPQGKFVYCVTGSGKQLVTFSTEDSQVEHTLPLGIAGDDASGMNDTIGIAHHPHVNLVASFSKKKLQLWRP